MVKVSTTELGGVSHKTSADKLFIWAKGLNTYALTLVTCPGTKTDRINKNGRVHTQC